jgi:hypothetical protein
MFLPFIKCLCLCFIQFHYNNINCEKCRHTRDVLCLENCLMPWFSWTKKININYRCFIYDCKKLLNNKICLKVKKIKGVLFNGYVVIVLVVSLQNHWLQLFVFIGVYWCPMLPVSLDCPFLNAFISIVPLIAHLIFYCRHCCLRRSCLSLIFHIKFFSETTEPS